MSRPMFLGISLLVALLHIVLLSILASFPLLLIPGLTHLLVLFRCCSSPPTTHLAQAPSKFTALLGLLLLPTNTQSPELGETT